MSDAPLTVTLLDEELALLAPGCGPLPHLDGLDDAAHDVALQTSARSLLVRGLAVPDGPGLLPAPDLVPLLAPLTGGTAVHLVAALRDTADAVLTVFHDVPGDPDVLVHDTNEDGVHLLTLLPRAQAHAQLAGALDPLGRTAVPAPVPGVAVEVEEPEAVARMTAVGADGTRADLAVVSAHTGCWCLRAGGPEAAEHLDRDALLRLVAGLLPG